MALRVVDAGAPDPETAGCIREDMSCGQLLAPDALTGQGNAQWHLVARDIAAAIEAGRYAPGGRLLVSDLVTDHHAGKGVIGRALAELRALGYVERQGSRIRVAARPPRAQLRASPDDAVPQTWSGRAAPRGNGPHARIGARRPGRRGARLLELLAAHPGGLTCAQAAEHDNAPGLAGSHAARQQALTRYGSPMRCLERAGMVARSGMVPGAQGRPPAIIWTITALGRQMLPARISGTAMRLLELLAAHPDGLTCAQAAEHDNDPGLAGSHAARQQTLKRYSSRMQALKRAGLAARSGTKATGNAGAPPVVWAITEYGDRIAAAACQQTPACELAAVGAGDGHARACRLFFRDGRRP